MHFKPSIILLWLSSLAQTPEKDGKGMFLFSNGEAFRSCTIHIDTYTIYIYMYSIYIESSPLYMQNNANLEICEMSLLVKFCTPRLEIWHLAEAWVCGCRVVRDSGVMVNHGEASMNIFPLPEHRHIVPVWTKEIDIISDNYLHRIT